MSPPVLFLLVSPQLAVLWSLLATRSKPARRLQTNLSLCARVISHHDMGTRPTMG